MTPQDIPFNAVSEKKPQASELRDAEFAWLCVKHVKSNAIVIAKVCTFILRMLAVILMANISLF